MPFEVAEDQVKVVAQLFAVMQKASERCRRLART